MSEQAKTRTATTKRAGSTGTSTASGSTPSTSTSDAPIAPPPLPDRSPRTDVAVNVGVVETAFQTGAASQSVGYVQHMLRARGFPTDNTSGIVDRSTIQSYARFQLSIKEEPTGLPTAYSLDYLGFDVY
jgi:hypothetical protein